MTLDKNPGPELSAQGNKTPSAPYLELARWVKTTVIQAYFAPPPPSAPIETIGSLGSVSREKWAFSARQSSYGALGSAGRLLGLWEISSEKIRASDLAKEPFCAIMNIRRIDILDRPT